MFGYGPIYGMMIKLHLPSLPDGFFLGWFLPDGLAPFLGVVVFP